MVSCCSSVSPFLSTLSLRRATCCPAITPAGITYFYPRSPCGERPGPATIQAPRPIFLSTLSLRRATGRVLQDITPAGISIHALLAESDRRAHVAAEARSQFLSTLSLRRATDLPPAVQLHISISIHALLAESDTFKRLWLSWQWNFYPRSPCGERPMSAAPPARRGH